MLVDAPRLELRPLDDDNLVDLLDAAVAGTDPAEVMPPVPGPPGWTGARRSAFYAFHRERSVWATRPVETTYLIVADDQVVGAGRLEPVGADVEFGIWVSQPWRGRGVGRRVATELLERARRAGARRVVASTTAENAAAVGVLHGLGANLTVIDGTVEAVLAMPEPRAGWGMSSHRAGRTAAEHRRRPGCPFPPRSR